MTTQQKIAINKFPTAKQFFINSFDVKRKNCFGISFLFENKLFGTMQLRDITFCSKTSKIVSDKIVEDKYI